jgi:hypothetical protein
LPRRRAHHFRYQPAQKKAAGFGSSRLANGLGEETRIQQLTNASKSARYGYTDPITHRHSNRHTWLGIGRNHRGLDETPARNSHRSADPDTRVETRRDLTFRNSVPPPERPDGKATGVASYTQQETSLHQNGSGTHRSLLMKSSSRSLAAPFSLRNLMTQSRDVMENRYV